MRSEHVEEMLLIRYLLGNLSETEEAQIEDRAFSDADYLGALEAAEADLIDAYVRGELAQPDRQSFERRFLTSPDRQSRVQFARTLARVTAESTAPLPASQPLTSLVARWTLGLQFAAAFAALICIVVPSWLIFQNAGMRSELTILQKRRGDLEANEQQLRRLLAEQQSRAESLIAQQQQQQSTATVPVVPSLVLLPGLSRADARIEQLALTSSAQIARIEIQLEARDDYSRFRAELRTRRGEEVLTRGNLPRRRTNTGYIVSLEVPASALAPGEYELSLKGVAGPQAAVDIGYYYFHVRKQ